VAGGDQLLGAVLNLSRYHREHEKFYSQAPLEQAIALQRASRTLKTLAARWEQATPAEHPVPNPFAGAEDLNEPAAVQADGVLFMEGEGEPAEIGRLKRDLSSLADDFEQTGSWLGPAMAASWQSAASLLRYPGLADLLGERHRIIANDWQAAELSSLVARLVRRASEILGELDLSPAAIRGDLASARVFSGYLYSSSELLDRAADLAVESATLVHDNERRWRVFRARVAALVEDAGQAVERSPDEGGVR
jgi:hypothetical protein